MKTLTTFTFLLVLGLSSITSAQAKSFEILNQDVFQGDVVMIRILPQWQGSMVCVSVFEKEYIPNKHGYVFVGVDVNMEPTNTQDGLDKYLVYLVECGRGVRLGWYYDEIAVMKKNFPTVRLKGNGLSAVSKKRAQERQLIQAVFDLNLSPNHIEDVFHYPLQRIDVSTNGQFGTKRIYRNGYISLHRGVDLRTKENIKDKGLKPVMAVNSGRIVLTGKFSLEGNMVIMDHGQKIFSIYMHLSKITVKPGQKVNRGQKIAIAGATGRGTGPHLHFAMKIDNTAIDPLAFIEATNKYLK